MASSEELAKQIEQMQALMEQLQEAIAPIEEEKKQLDAEEREAYKAYQAAVAKARERKALLDEKGFEFQKAINDNKWKLVSAQNELKEAQRKEELEKARKEREAELALLNEKWDKLTAAAHWREWAKDHQIKAGHLITENRKVILADPMGLGKTLSSIITVDMVEAATRLATPKFPFLGEEKQVYNYSTGENELKIVDGIERPVGKRILYFCPSSLIRNVEKEFRMWAKHRNVTFVGGMNKQEREFAFNFVLKSRPDYVVICNYEAWRRDKNLIKQFIDLDPDTVIMDEAHMLKDRKSVAYRGVKQILDETQPEYVIPMTGTPILNRPQELFSLLTLVNPNEFYHENDFLYSYCQQIDGSNYWKFQPGGLDRIAKRIRKNFIRRTKDQAGIELPEKTIINHDLEVDIEAYPAQAKVREQMRRYMTIMVNEEKGQAITAAAVIAMFTRLRQIETWPAGIEMRDPLTKEVTFAVDVEESQKVDYVISNGPDEQGNWNGLIPEAIADERMVLFSQFTAPLHEIKRRVELAGYRAVILDGSVPTAQREEIGTDFDLRYTPDRANSKWDIVLCNYRVGGVGLNLTAATQMVILDEEWNPGKRDQAYDRIHRIGQEKPVTIHVIRNQKTIDDWLAGIMETKESVVEGFNSTMVSVQDFKEFLDDSGLM